MHCLLACITLQKCDCNDEIHAYTYIHSRLLKGVRSTESGAKKCVCVISAVLTQFRAGIQGFDLDAKRDNEKKTKSRLREKVVHYARTHKHKNKKRHRTGQYNYILATVIESLFLR